MGLSFSEIKNNFVRDYLSKQPQYKDEPLIADDINLSAHYKDFQKYLVKENLADESIFSKSLSQLEFVDGKFVDKEQAQKEEEAQGEDAESKSSVDDNFMTDFLNDLLSQDDVINALDADASGDLNVDEVNGFLDEYAEVDENGEKTITLEGLSEGMQCELMLDTMYEDEKIVDFADTDGDGKLSDEEKAQFEAYMKGENENLTPDLIQEAYNKLLNPDMTSEELQELKNEYDNFGYQQEAQNYNNYVASAGGSGGVSSAGGASYNYEEQELDLNKPIDEMNLRELRAALQETKKDIETVDKEKEEAQKELDEASKALENDGLTQEQLEQRDKMKDDIADKEETIKGLEDEKTNKQGEIDNTKSQLSEANENLANLKAELANATEEEKPAIEAQIKEVEAEIQRLQEQLDKENEELTAIEEKISNEQEALAAMQEELQTFEEDKNQENLQKYDEAKQKFEAGDFENKLQELQTRQQDIQTRIDERAGSGEEAAEFALSFVGCNEADGSADKFLGGSSSSKTPWCAAFTQYALENSIGKENLPDWYNAIGNKWYCRNIQHAAQQAGAVVSANDAQPGDLVTFGGDPAGHIGIVLKVENGVVYTVEGNTSNRVATRQYSVNNGGMTFCSMS